MMSNSMNSESSESTKALRILVVEDEGDPRDTLANVLRDIGHTVSVAASMAEALKAIDLDKFDVILSDISLPDGSSYPLIVEAKRRLPLIRAVALVGFGTEPDAHLSGEAGFDFHLTRPLDFRELRTVLASLS